MKKPYVGRVVAVVSALISLALAVLPAVLNFDWRSTAGVIGGIVAVLGLTQTWLKGLQQHEGYVAQGFFGLATAQQTAEPAPWPPPVMTGVDPDPPVPPVEGPPDDEDTDVPNPDPSVAKPELDDPEWKPRAKAKRRTKR